MKSAKIPANLDSALRASKLIDEKIAEIAAESAKRKKPSLRQELQKERLEGLRITSVLNDEDMNNLGALLDPEVFDQRASEIHEQLASLSKEDLVESLARTMLELEMERGYAAVANRSIDQFEHIADGDEYRKIKSNDNRQDKRNENFAKDEEYLLKTLNTLKKRKNPIPLTWDEFEVFRHDVHLNKPEPSFKQEVRVVGEAKQLTGEELAIHKEVTKDMNPGWSNSRLRDFFTRHTGLSPKQE
jgi:cytochrome c553